MGFNLTDLINSILNLILSSISGVLNVILYPINLLVDGLFPDMSTAINNFTNMVNLYFGNGITFFGRFIPPMTKNMLTIAITFTISYYTVTWSYLAISKIWFVIKKLKFW